jgi:hypothetical protein
MLRGWRGKLFAGVLAFAAVTVLAPANRAQAQCYYGGYAGYGLAPFYGLGLGYGFGYYSAPGYGAVVPRSYYHNSGYYGFYRAPYYRGYWRGYYGGHYGYHHHGYYHGGHRW